MPPPLADGQKSLSVRLHPPHHPAAAGFLQFVVAEVQTQSICCRQLTHISPPSASLCSPSFPVNVSGSQAAPRFPGRDCAPRIWGGQQLLACGEARDLTALSPRFALEPLLPKKMHSRSQDKLDKDDPDKDRKDKKKEKRNSKHQEIVDKELKPVDAAPQGSEAVILSETVIPGDPPARPGPLGPPSTQTRRAVPSGVWSWL